MLEEQGPDREAVLEVESRSFLQMLVGVEQKVYNSRGQGARNQEKLLCEVARIPMKHCSPCPGD